MLTSWVVVSIGFAIRGFRWKFPRMPEQCLVEPEKTRSEKPSAPGAGKVKTNERSRYIPMPVRRKISKRSEGACEYVAATTGKRCASRFAIQSDHVDPFAMGGKTTANNLRHFCHTHNKLAAIQAFGNEVMEQWIGKT